MDPVTRSEIRFGSIAVSNLYKAFFIYRICVTIFSMNQNEIKVIRGKLKVNSKKMYLSRIVTAYIVNVDGTPAIKSYQHRFFDELPEEEQDLHIKMVKKALSGRLGRNLNEYAFPHDEQGGSHFQKALYMLNQSRLEDEKSVRKFIENLIPSVMYTSGYYLTLLACEYKVPVLDANQEENEEASGTVHRFLLLTTNEVAPADLGLYYNSDQNLMEKKAIEDLHVLSGPYDGIMYPVFTDRMSDVNHVLYYTKDPKAPNTGLLEELLGVEPNQTPDAAREAFTSLIEDVTGEELNLQMYKKIFQDVRSIVTDDEQPEQPELSRQDMQNILTGAGVSNQKMELFSSKYEHNIGQESLQAVNAMDTDKLSIKAADVSVTIKPDAAYKVRTQMIDGGLYLCIAIDDGLRVNGLDIKK